MLDRAAEREALLDQPPMGAIRPAKRESDASAVARQDAVEDALPVLEVAPNAERSAVRERDVQAPDEALRPAALELYIPVAAPSAA